MLFSLLCCRKLVVTCWRMTSVYKCLWSTWRNSLSLPPPESGHHITPPSPPHPPPSCWRMTSVYKCLWSTWRNSLSLPPPESGHHITPPSPTPPPLLPSVPCVDITGLVMVHIVDVAGTADSGATPSFRCTCISCVILNCGLCVGLISPADIISLRVFFLVQLVLMYWSMHRLVAWCICTDWLHRAFEQVAVAHPCIMPLNIW